MSKIKKGNKSDSEAHRESLNSSESKYKVFESEGVKDILSLLNIPPLIRKPRKSKKKGTLMKMGKFFKTWRERYFILTSNTLKYYETKHSHQYFLGVIHLEDISPVEGHAARILGKPFYKALNIPKQHENVFCIHVGRERKGTLFI